MRAGRSRRNFRDQLAEIVSGDPILEAVFASLIAVHETVCHQATDLDDEIRQIAKDSPLARRLTTVPGDVGDYLGLTPRRYQSGETDWSSRISKRGDRGMRKLLHEAANILIQRVPRFSPLKA